MKLLSSQCGDLDMYTEHIVIKNGEFTLSLQRNFIFTPKLATCNYCITLGVEFTICVGNEVLDCNLK